MPDIEQPARVAPLAPSERTERQAALVAQAGAELNVYTTLVRNPDVFADFLPFGQRLLTRSTLDGRVRELLILRAAWRCGAGYIWSHHTRIGRSVGVTDADLEALARDTVEDGDAVRALTLRVADELVADHRLSDPTWRDLAARYPTEQVIEVCMLVGFYAMLAGTLNSLGVQVEEPGAGSAGR
ncbi:carboxymuconolactone decarboxylase family protein [Virgisporangium aurantiacum]|uniref:Carboxymuconolactone decarboxylase n=1 Tax=Virgisporangium aurantiacum TaxID=175570 RepID=A0A8J3Z4Q5_9ACTN|nr:carboxymuconolactone decarboxylase family protein [Virgisporangium aurantiacum]GIJ56268.1 carboxymuconolactone decarboxylase [Virgisporangium aurantiacum]